MRLEVLPRLPLLRRAAALWGGRYNRHTGVLRGCHLGTGRGPTARPARRRCDARTGRSLYSEKRAMPPVPGTPGLVVEAAQHCNLSLDDVRGYATRARHVLSHHPGYLWDRARGGPKTPGPLRGHAAMAPRSPTRRPTGTWWCRWIRPVAERCLTSPGDAQSESRGVACGGSSSSFWSPTTSLGC